MFAGLWRWPASGIEAMHINSTTDFQTVPFLLINMPNIADASHLSLVVASE